MTTHPPSALEKLKEEENESAWYTLPHGMKGMKLIFIYKNFWKLLKINKDNPEAPCGNYLFPYLSVIIGTDCMGRFSIDIALIGHMVTLLIG